MVDTKSIFTDKKLFVLDANIKGKLIAPFLQITETAYSKKYGFRRNVMRQFGKILWVGMYIYLGNLTFNLGIHIIRQKNKKGKKNG
jgi:hypothetical protein